MTKGFRQEVLNVVLAQLLQERGVVSAPETVLTAGLKQARRMPDVILDFNGLRIVIEGEVDDQPTAHERAILSARGRVEEGIAHIGVAVVYPSRLRKTTFKKLRSELASSKIDIAIVTESGDTGFIKGDVDNLESALRQAFEQLVKEDVVARAVAELDAEIENFADHMSRKGGIVGRVSQVLGIRELSSESTED